MPEGQVVDRLVSSIDIAPTILALAGIETNVPMMGRNLLASSPVPAVGHSPILHMIVG